MGYKCLVPILVWERRLPTPTSNSQDTSWVSYNSTQSWHYLWGDNIRFHRIRVQSSRLPPAPPNTHTYFRCQLQAQVVICTSDKLVKIRRFLRSHSSGLINLLEQLTELRGRVYWLDHQFIIKGYNSGKARWKRCIGQGTGKLCGAFMPSPQISMSSLIRKFSKLYLLGFYGGFWTGSWLIKSLTTGNWFNL